MRKEGLFLDTAELWTGCSYCGNLKGSDKRLPWWKAQGKDQTRRFTMSPWFLSSTRWDCFNDEEQLSFFAFSCAHNGILRAMARPWNCRPRMCREPCTEMANESCSRLWPEHSNKVRRTVAMYRWSQKDRKHIRFYPAWRFDGVLCVC